MASIRAHLHAGTAGTLSLSLLLNAVPVTAQVAPSDATVAAGAATVSAPSANTVVVDQSSQKAVIDWRTFDVAPDQTLRFNQPDASAIALNRIQGGAPTSFQGTLLANGQVWIVNPNGIVFGKSARVDAAGLIATTLDISNSDFMSGRYAFSGPDNGAIVVNGGRITIRDAGLAALVAPNVQNSGVITAHYGKVTLGSATSFTLDFYGDGLTQFAATGGVGRALTEQGGDSGRVLMTASGVKAVVDRVVNISPDAEATSLVNNAGKITLLGPASGNTEVSGTVDVSAPQGTGGTIDVTGKTVELARGSALIASGSAQGGTVRVGGDWHGTGDLPNATTTTVADGALIDASSSAGTGGSVDVWSDAKTSFAGRIDAQGALAGGNAEVSGKKLLAYSGTTDLRSAKGAAGTLLLDPRNVTIKATGGTAPTLPGTGPITLNPASDDSILLVSTLQSALALGNVIITTGSDGTQAGDITVASNISWSNGSNLTLLANRNIVVNDGVTIANTGAGTLALHADSTGSGTGTVTFNGSGKVNYSASTGTVSLYYNPSSGYTSPTSFASNVSTNGSVSGQLTAYMLVNDVNQLQAINTNLTGNYALGRDIDASATASWNSGAGFRPIGPDSTGFDGVFDGQNYVIDRLVINISNITGNSFSIGLFGRANQMSIMRNLVLKDANITVSQSPGGQRANAGILVGSNYGNINDVKTSGVISGAGNTGGIAGQNAALGSNATILRSASSARVIGGVGSLAGGLVGANASAGPSAYALISQSYFNGDVTGDIAGGIAGATNFGSGGLSGGGIDNSYSSGTVTTNASSFSSGYAGGIVGGSRDSIRHSYASGFVAGIATGGIDGYNQAGDTSTAYFDSTVNSSIGPYGNGPVALTDGKLTTAQLKSGLPTGFDPAIWAISPSVNNGYPYLKWQTAGASAQAPQAVSFGVTPTPTPTPPPTPTPVPTPTPSPTPTPTPPPAPGSVNGVAQLTGLDQANRSGLNSGQLTGVSIPALSLQQKLLAYEGQLWSLKLDLQQAAGAALSFAYLADAVYGSDRSNIATPDGRQWHVEASWEELLRTSYLKDLYPGATLDLIIAAMKASGFYANLYSDGSTRVLAFRGSEGLNLPDWVSNLLQLGGAPSSQYGIAGLLTGIVSKKYPGVILTGHSLGGGLAQYAAATYPSSTNAVVFNAAGLSTKSGLNGSGANVINIRIENDPISAVGVQLGLSYTLPANEFFTQTLGTGSSGISNDYLYLNNLYNAHTRGTMQGMIQTLTNVFVNGEVSKKR